MSIKIGNTNISSVYLGSTQISEVYIGATKVFPDTTQSDTPDTCTVGNWTNSGSIYNDGSPSTTTSYTAWTPTSGDSSLQYIDQTRTKTVTTTQPRKKNQIRSLTWVVNGTTDDTNPCDSYSSFRTVSVSDQVTTTNTTESRTTLNPNWSNPFTSSDWTGAVTVSASGSITATAGNGYPVSVVTNNFGTVSSPTSRTVLVDVTVPSGFSNFGQTVRVSRTVTQPANAQASTLTATIVENVDDATTGYSTITRTATIGDGVSFTVVITPDNDFEFNGINDVSDSISGVTLGAGSPQIDSFGNWLRTYQRTLASASESVTITLTGSATSTTPTLTASIIGSDSVDTSLILSYDSSIGGTASGTISYSWSFAYGGGQIMGSSTGSSISTQFTSTGETRLELTVTREGISTTTYKIINVAS